MKKEKSIKIIISIIIFAVVISIFNIANAADIVKEMNTALNPHNNPAQDSSIVYLLSRIFTAIQFIGTGISIIIVTRLGIVYMLTSVEEKAQIKQRAVPIVMGTFVLVATVNILKLIQVFVTNT